MNLKLILFSVVGVLFIVKPAPGAFIAASYTGAGATLNYKPDGTVYLQANPGSVAIQGSQPVMVPVQGSKPVMVPVQVSQNNVPVQVQVQSNTQQGQTVALIPINSMNPPYSYGNKISNVFTSISNAITTKTQSVADFLRSLCGGRPQYRPQYVLVNIPTTEKTTTTKCHKTTKTTTEQTTTEQTTESTTEQSGEYCDDCEE